jgi:photosystem II stability/assembly factor-like uncharacterized protein
MKIPTAILLLLCGSLVAQESLDTVHCATFKDLKFRNIGPAFSSGRIADIAIHPGDENCWFVAVGSGGVWKTVNAGVTWIPVFDSQGSYSIGCVTIDPVHPNTIWVGTGENVGGRHVGYGDGVYRSDDGGKTWKNMGLKESEHISKIVVHPDKPEVVFVAAQGPLWRAGGDRGLFKTTDGGKSWKKVLGGNEWTGVTDLVIDPLDPGCLYAATWQRHRNVAAYIGGGPGSGIHRSSDGGETWEKMTSGIPSSNLGKIGLAISPFNPDVIYAAIELDRRTGAVFMSDDRGVSWSKQSETVSGATGPHYYQELYASPHHEGTLYLADMRVQVSDDHGKTFRRMSEERKHPDNHAIAFRTGDPDYLLIGTDGGIYESFDNAENWRFVANLPVTQYYKVAVDDAEPFYNVFGGTQDNGSHGGPSRTDSEEGITNAHWFMILGGDGHQTATEPGNPGIVYAESQQGYLYRTDRVTGEQVFIQPQAGEGEPFERFNWDTPILVSFHDPARIYTASYRVWRSDNRGDSWRAISGDLTRDQERLTLPIMGRQQSWDNAWDVLAMSTYNTITSLAESPLVEGLIYAGTDDGTIQVTENGGESWRMVEVGSIKGIPSTAFVNDIRADLFDAKTVYAVLDNHKFGDFKPYVIRSSDAGRNWISIAGNLPGRTLVWRLVQDHELRDLLFAATEFGIYFTVDGGKQWIQLQGGVPTISFRDITIQRREDDLVAASFGRGFFILDDISPLRMITPDLMDQEAVLFPVKDPWLFAPKQISLDPGASEYRAENPPYGAVITYYLKEDANSLRSTRQESEKELEKQNAGIPFPGWDKLEAEIAEETPFVLFTIRDGEGTIVNHVKAPAKKGIHRVSWNLRRSSQRVVELEQPGDFPTPGNGFMATPGVYSVNMYLVNGDKVREVSGKQGFEVKPLRKGVLESATSLEIAQFRDSLECFQQEIGKAASLLERSAMKIASLNRACLSVEKDAHQLLEQVFEAESELKQLDRQLNGYQSRDQVGEKQAPTPRTRLSVASQGISISYGPTDLHRQSLLLGKKELEPLMADLKKLAGETLPALEEALMVAGAPWIEGEIH